MQLHLHFILLNSEFNKGLADDLYGGEESEDNIRQLWEDELVVSEPVKEFRIRNKDNYFLEGFFPGNIAFRFEIADTTVVEVVTDTDKKMQFAVSKKLIKKTEKKSESKPDETHLYFYLRDNIPLENPMDGVYIAKSDFPKELRSAADEQA